MISFSLSIIIPKGFLKKKLISLTFGGKRWQGFISLNVDNSLLKKRLI
jgi:hypothetical protein